MVELRGRGLTVRQIARDTEFLRGLTQSMPRMCANPRSTQNFFSSPSAHPLFPQKGDLPSFLRP